MIGSRPGMQPWAVREICQTVCKPGSVRPRGSGTAIPLRRASRRASRDQPGRRGGNPLTVACAPPAAPIRSCSRWGLPCRPRCRGRGALLPHRFTLARADAGGLISVALSLGSPPPAVSRHRFPMEPGLSSIACATAAVRPSGGARCAPAPGAGQASRKPSRSASSTRQVRAPPITAPVSMPMRLARSTGSGVGVWPCTTTAP